MKFVLIFGPQAVGKMSVGHALQEMTGLRLLHNHMTIEPLYAIFGAGPETWRLSETFRRLIFDAAAKSALEGLIFTFVWGFNVPGDWAFVEDTCRIFEATGADIYFVELEASLATRLERNRTSHRLEHKPTKRNLEWSEQELKSSMDKYRLNSLPGEITREHYLRIDNTELSPAEVAAKIRAHFHF